MAEFDLIYNIINRRSANREDVITGIGDDCAILAIPEGYRLAVTMDTLVAGVHFPKSAEPYTIGFKSLAVNLSDLASTGAVPAWVTLSLTMPQADESWLKEFMRGFYTLADQYNVQLIGGDTASGPLSITVQAHGFVKQAVLRSGAELNHNIYVTGTLGDAALGLRSYTAGEQIDLHCKAKLDCPQPRVEFGLQVKNYASSMIDLSDGLASDLQHICHQSQCGAEVYLDNIPVSSAYRIYFQNEPDLLTAITFGDDYELCFTSDAGNETNLIQISKQLGLQLSCIGKITAGNAVSYFDTHGNAVAVNKKGFEHFS